MYTAYMCTHGNHRGLEKNYKRSTELVIQSILGAFREKRSRWEVTQEGGSCFPTPFMSIQKIPSP